MAGENARSGAFADGNILTIFSLYDISFPHNEKWGSLMASEAKQLSNQIISIASSEKARIAGDVRARVSEAEWQARVELAALYRMVAYFRWTDMIYNHISLRVPDGEETYLLNPFGLFYDEITASSLVKVSVDGTVLDDPTGLGINRAGFVIHGAVHAARRDVTCVMHTHTRAGCAVAAQEHGLLPISQYAATLTGHVAYHDFEGVAVNEEERERLVADLGDRNVLILRNHGLLTCGRNPGETLVYMYAVERACDIQVAALSGGGEVRHITPEAAAMSGEIHSSMGGDFSRDWEAMLRLVDRIGPDFRN